MFNGKKVAGIIGLVNSEKLHNIEMGGKNGEREIVQHSSQQSVDWGQ